MHMARRGSAGHIHGVGSPMSYEGDLRHAATNHAAQMQIRGWAHEGGVWDVNSTLAAPFDGSSLPNTVPPEVSFLLSYSG